MTKKVREQILKVRDTGLTNMFAINGVQTIAYRLGLYELVNYLAEKKNHGEYAHFIITGEANIVDAEDGTHEEAD